MTPEQAKQMGEEVYAACESYGVPAWVQVGIAYDGEPDYLGIDSGRMPLAPVVEIGEIVKRYV